MFLYPALQRHRIAFALLSTLALGACAGAVHEPATMGRGGPDYGTSALSSARAVDLIAVGPANIELYALSAPQSVVGGASDDWVYRLGVGDTVQLFVVNEPEMTRPGGADAGYLVEADGMIQLPFLGRVQADGQTIAALRAELVRRLTQYLPNPQVDVRVTGFNARHVAVVGSVARPSRQTLTTTPLTAIDAINAAGGFAPGAENDSVVLIRNGVEQSVDIRAFMTHGQATPVLHDGDVLRVGGRSTAPTAPRGEPVAAPDSIRLHMRTNAPMTIALGAQAVGLGQILAAGAQPDPWESVYVLRNGAGGRVQALILSSDIAMNPALGGRLAVMPGDSIVVAAASAGMGQADHLSLLTPALRAMNP